MKTFRSKRVKPINRGKTEITFAYGKEKRAGTNTRVTVLMAQAWSFCGFEHLFNSHARWTRPDGRNNSVGNLNNGRINPYLLFVVARVIII